jgi:hypothetical protein
MSGRSARKGISSKGLKNGSNLRHAKASWRYFRKNQSQISQSSRQKRLAGRNIGHLICKNFVEAHSTARVYSPQRVVLICQKEQMQLLGAEAVGAKAKLFSRKARSSGNGIGK